MKKVISIILAACLTVMLFPTTALAASPVTVSSNFIYANGNAIILAAGNTTNYTCVYLDNDRDGVIDAEDVIQTITGATGAANANGYDLSTYYVIGGNQSTALAGNTKITMLGGNVQYIYGGGGGAGATVANTSVTVFGGHIYGLMGGGINSTATVGSTSITINGGMVFSELYGGGLHAAVSGSTTITINGGQIAQTFCGGGWNNTATVGSTNITVNGGLIDSSIYGSGYSGAVSGSTNITVNGGMIDNNIFGSNYSATAGSTSIIIGGGTVNGDINASLNVTGTKSIKITGGSILGSVTGPTPKQSDGITSVYKTTLALSGINTETNVSSTLTLGGVAAGYGLTDVKTNVIGGLTFYLPIGASTAAYSTNGTHFAATVANTGSNAFVLLLSTTPTVTNATVAKSTATQAAVDFTLDTALTGTWKVYNAPTGGSLVAGVTASASGTTLTLTHASDIPAGTYYVSLTEAGKTESTRLALTINPSNIATVATVKGLVEGATYTMTQASAIDEATVKAAIEAKIATLALDGVTPVVTKVLYTPAAAGDAGTPAGTNGTYTFDVDLSKGAASDTTATLTMTVTATAYDVDASNTASVGTVKGLVQGVAYTMTQAAAIDEAAVEAAVEAQIATLALDGVTPIVTKVLYTPAVAGDAGTPAGTNGTYTFTVDLSKGAASDTTATLTMTVTATAFDVAAANTASVATVKGLVEGEAYTMTLASATDEAAVEAAVEAQIATLALDGVTPIVTKVLYTPAVAGDAGTPAGTNGTYTFTVDLSKGAASDTTATLTMTVTATAYVKHSSGEGTSGGNNSVEPKTQPIYGADILVNGNAVNAGTAVDTKQGERTVTTVTIDEQKLEQKLEAEGDKATVTIPVKTNSDVIIGELNGQMVKNMENKQAVVQIKTDAATYTLPAQQINIDAVSGQLGMDIELKDIKVAIEIAKPEQEIVEIVKNSAKTGEFTIIAPAMEFNISCSYNGRTIDVSKFNAYVERTIAIPEGADKTKITTGVIVDTNGTVRHVPTQIIIIDGKYYAQINSLTNSTYSVVWNPVTFKDAENHWAKEAVNDMASRLIVSGVGDDLFDPDRDITRAEFAAIIVRALGLKPDTGNSSFKDVSSLDWYSGYVNTAYKYNIITGYGEDLFGPSDKITREQAMTMIAKSMKITGLTCEFKSGELEQMLSEYSDSQNAAMWARENIAACIKAGIVSGKDDGTIEPNDEITRAEVAVLVRRLLQRSNLI